MPIAPSLPGFLSLAESGPPLLWLALVGGLVLLLVGGDGLSRGSASLALQLRIPPIVVGLTVVSAATSAPELFTSVVSLAEGREGLALGNIIGSNAANLGLILAVAALIHPLAVESRLVRQELPVLVGTTLLFPFLAASGGGLSTFDGLLFLALLGLYLFLLVRSVRGSHYQESVAEDLPRARGGTGVALLLVAGGTALLWLGADLAVAGASELARRAGVSETLVGITLVAVGTSLPELGAAGVAAYRRQSGLVVGNVIGSNLFNLLLICGIGAISFPFPVADRILRAEYLGVVALTALFAGLAWSRGHIGRRTAFLLLLLYGAFLFFAVSLENPVLS
jgi:cation:H+ antiporter